MEIACRFRLNQPKKVAKPHESLFAKFKIKHFMFSIELSKQTLKNITIVLYSYTQKNQRIQNFS